MTPEEQLLNMSNLSPEERRFLQDSFKPQSSMPQGLMTDKDYSRIMPTGSPQQGLLSRIRGGLLDAGQAVGSGLLGAGRAAVAGIDPKQMSRDIIDTQRFYRQAQMSQPSMVLGSDLAKLQNITPQGIAASLPALRAQEQLALQKPEIEKLEALAALERAKGTGSLASLTTSPKTYVTIGPDGEREVVETFFDKVTRQRLIMGTNQPLPAGSIELSADDMTSFQNLAKFDEDASQEESSLRALDAYIGNVEGSPAGIQRAVSSLVTKVKSANILPDNWMKLTDEELALEVAKAQQQGLLGRFREQVVGGGVMTEMDALRVLRAMGGDLGTFSSKEKTLKILSELRDETFKKYTRKRNLFNSAYDATLDVQTGKSIYADRRSRPEYTNPFIKEDGVGSSAVTPTNKVKRVVVSADEMAKAGGK